jgi:hypothetical protein
MNALTKKMILIIVGASFLAQSTTPSLAQDRKTGQFIKHRQVGITLMGTY